MTENTRKNWLKKIKDQGEVPTPYILTDLSIVEDSAKRLKSLLNNVKIYYAVKSNSDPKIIERLNPIVEGYDIASLGEWELLRKKKVSPKRVLFSNPVKIPSHIEKTYKDGLRYYALDSTDEIKKLSRLAPGSNVYIRVQVSDYGSKFPLSKKTGLLPAHVTEYASFAESMGLKVCGLAFHVGSQSENPQVWDRAFEITGELITRLQEMGCKMEFLDIGGGFPADYGQPIPSISVICRLINKAIKKYIPAGIEVVAEPGRFLVAESSVIVTEIIAREHRSGTDWLHLDMGVFQGIMEPLEMRSWKYPTFTEKNPRGYKKDFVLTGPTCDAYDTIGTDYSLPSEMNTGDKIYIGSAGAYTSVYGSNFNGFEKPEVRFVR
ncbi:MAG TPA: type III PLP-dependent enzyme [Candidatus Saccharimonadales bacterium]|nr:type III PLP-dependent enzyme [Candidatus Saccharimonadales bacterium]